MHRLTVAISAYVGLEEGMEVYNALQTCGRPDRPSIATGCPCRSTTSSLNSQALGGRDGRVVEKMSGVVTTIGGMKEGRQKFATSTRTAIKITSVITIAGTVLRSAVPTKIPNIRANNAYAIGTIPHISQ